MEADFGRGESRRVRRRNSCHVHHPAGNPGPFSTIKIAVIAFVGAKVLFAIHTGPAIVGAVLFGVAAKGLPPTARGNIRGIYAAARELVRSRVAATSHAGRQIAEPTNAHIRTKIVNGVLIITIWVAFAIEVWRTNGAFTHAVEAEK